MHVDELLVVSRLHLVDGDSNRMRQLVTHSVERSLADELGDHHRFGLVGELAVRVERRALGQLCDQQVSERVELVAGRGGHRDHVGPVAELGDASELLGHPVTGRGVGFGDHGEFRRTGDLGQLPREEAVTGANRLVRGHTESNDVDA